MRRVVVLAAAVLFAAMLGAPARAAGAHPVDAQKSDCTELVPHSASPGLTKDDGKKITLSVALLLDGVDANGAAKVAKRAAAAYAPLDITLSVTQMKAVSLKADADGKRAEATRLIADAKKLLGGKRPAGTDVVFILTKKDIYDGVSAGDVVGMADCIGGVEDPTRAFAVGEYGDDPVDLGVARMYDDETAKILAHEIGHLMGAQHHLAGCGDGVVDLADGELAPCSLMSNFVDLQSLRFDVVNGAIVRGHASSYARP